MTKNFMTVRLVKWRRVRRAAPVVRMRSNINVLDFSGKETYLKIES